MSEEHDRQWAVGAHYDGDDGYASGITRLKTHGRRLLAVVLAAAALGVMSALVGCGAEYTPGGGIPSADPTLLEPDDGWVSAGGAGFKPAPFKHRASQRPGGSTLVGTTGSEARVKWIAERAEAPGFQDARSRISIHVVDVTDPANRADIVFRGAGGSGSAELPIEAGKRTVYRLTWTAVGTYRWCSALIEVRTP